MTAVHDWSTFNVSFDSARVLVPCVEVVVFFDSTDDDAILRFYQSCREVLGGDLTHYQAESMKTFAKLNSRANSMVPTWFTRPRPGKLDYYMFLSSVDLNEETTPTTVELSVFRRPAKSFDEQADERARLKAKYEAAGQVRTVPSSKIRVTLPVDHAHARPESLRRWVRGLDVVNISNDFTGYCGYALNYFLQAARPRLYTAAKQALA
jgi:hypothetical protein